MRFNGGVIIFHLELFGFSPSILPYQGDSVILLFILLNSHSLCLLISVY